MNYTNTSIWNDNIIKIIHNFFSKPEKLDNDEYVNHVKSYSTS